MLQQFLDFVAVEEERTQRSGLPIAARILFDLWYTIKKTQLCLMLDFQNTVVETKKIHDIIKLIWRKVKEYESQGGLADTWNRWRLQALAVEQAQDDIAKEKLIKELTDQANSLE